MTVQNELLLPAVTPLLGTSSLTSHRSKAVTVLFADRHHEVDVSKCTEGM